MTTYSNRTMKHGLPCIVSYVWLLGVTAGPSGRAVQDVGLLPLACWYCGFETSLLKPSEKEGSVRTKVTLLNGKWKTVKRVSAVWNYSLWVSVQSRRTVNINMAERQYTVVCTFEPASPKITTYDIRECIHDTLRIPEKTVDMIQIDGPKRKVYIKMTDTQCVQVLFRDTCGQAEYRQ